MTAQPTVFDRTPPEAAPSGPILVAAAILLALLHGLTSQLTAQTAGDEPTHDRYLSEVTNGAVLGGFEEDFDLFGGRVMFRMTPIDLPVRADLRLQVNLYYNSDVWNRTDVRQTHVASSDTTDHMGGSGWQLHAGKVFNPNGAGSSEFNPDSPLLVLSDGTTKRFYNSDNGGFVSADRWIARRCRARSGVSFDGNAGLDEAPSLRALHRPLLRPRRAVTKAETSPSPLLNVGTPPDKRSSANTPIGASPSTSSPVAWAVRDRRVHPAQALPGPRTAAGLGKFRGETAPPGHHPTEDRAPHDALASPHRKPKAADCARTSPTR